MLAKLWLLKSSCVRPYLSVCLFIPWADLKQLYFVIFYWSDLTLELKVTRINPTYSCHMADSFGLGGVGSTPK